MTRMKNFLGIFCLAVLIVSPTLSFGITFDIWETGMSISEVVGVARNHDIPIARDGIIHAMYQVENYNYESSEVGST